MYTCVIYYGQRTMTSIWNEVLERRIAMRHVVTTKVSLRVTAGGHEVRIPMLGLVWQESMCAVAAMSKKTTVESAFTTQYRI